MTRLRAPGILAITASAAVVFAAPFVGGIRGAIQAAFPGHYRTIVVSVVLGAVILAAAAAVSRIRDRRTTRFGLVGLSLLIGIVYARATASGNADVDAVEHFHFVEYGLLALLYYRVWRARCDISTLAMPMLAGLLVGTFDEWLQWFIPFRVGEMRDVLLNGVALLCGLLFGIGLTPPGRLVLVVGRESQTMLAGMAIATIAGGAAFFHAVHLGHEVRLPPDVRFFSRFSAGQLAAAARDRAARWGSEPPVERRFSREDHYLSEGRWHIQERNQAGSAGDIRTAWHEELILEAFFAPVLDVLPADRWPIEQRADAQARAAGEQGPFRSEAHPYPIYSWRPALFWTAIAAAVAVLAWVGRVGRDVPRLRAGQPA